MSTEKFFTLHVTLIDTMTGVQSGEKSSYANLDMYNKGFELKDLTGTDIAKYKETIYTQGIKIQQTPTSWEFISPFRILTVRVLQQESKFAL